MYRKTQESLYYTGHEWLPACECHFDIVDIHLLVNRLGNFDDGIRCFLRTYDVWLSIGIRDNKSERRVVADVLSSSELKHCFLRVSAIVILLLCFAWSATVVFNGSREREYGNRQTGTILLSDVRDERSAGNNINIYNIGQRLFSCSFSCAAIRCRSM